MNRQAAARDYTIKFTTNLSITNVDSVKVQASAVSTLTNTPTELTLQAVVNKMVANFDEILLYRVLDGLSEKIGRLGQCTRWHGTISSL